MYRPIATVPIGFSAFINVISQVAITAHLINIISVKIITLKSYKKNVSILLPAIVYFTDIISRIIIAIISVLEIIIRIPAEIRNADVAAGAVIKITIKIIISLKTRNIRPRKP